MRRREGLFLFQREVGKKVNYCQYSCSDWCLCFFLPTGFFLSHYKPASSHSGSTCSGHLQASFPKVLSLVYFSSLSSNIQIHRKESNWPNSCQIFLSGFFLCDTWAYCKLWNISFITKIILSLHQRKYSKCYCWKFLPISFKNHDFYKAVCTS